MSKSAGNVVLVQHLVERGLDPLALRLSLLENRYRSQMDLTWAGLDAANSTLKRWRTNMATWGENENRLEDPEILSAIEKDLDTPRLLLRLRALEKDASIPNELKRSIFLYADSVLGLDLNRIIDVLPLNSDQLELLQLRAQAREDKNWSESDRLRDLLSGSGITISDGPEGQSWSWS
jgi:cysteinyl-tRNA synthetase